MYNATTQSYTLEDASGSYDWIVEGIERDDCSEMTDVDIYAWIDELIEQSKEQDVLGLEERIEQMTFPVQVYSTENVISSADEYEDMKRKEMDEDYQHERESAFQFLKNWISSS